MRTAAKHASAYPAQETTFHRRICLEIKPRPKTFVFNGVDSVPPITIRDVTGETPTQAMNTLTQELQHIDVATARVAAC